MTWPITFLPLIVVLQGILLFSISPLLAGFESWIAARLQGRPRSLRYVVQPYRDLKNLFTIDPVRPKTASWLFIATPPMLFVISFLLLFTLPWGILPPLLAMDLILLAYLLGLHRFLLSLAGLDGATPFGALGGGRAMFMNFVIEVNFFLFVIALLLPQPAPLASPLSEIIHQHAAWNWGIFSEPALLLLAVVLGMLILYELERIPVGDPTSHLELTMGEKAITLAWQGRDLAWIKLAEMMKLTFFIALFIDLFLPGVWPLPSHAPHPTLWAAFLFFPKLFLVTFIMTSISTTRAKLRLTRISGPAFFAGALSLLSIVFTITKGM